MSQSIGHRIREFRRQGDLTLQTVADELGLTPAAISHWESGRIVPKGRKLLELAKILKVSPGDLKGTGATPGGAPTPMAEISQILRDARRRIADRMGCEPQDVELEWRIK